MVSGYSKELFDKLVPPKPSGEPRNVVYIACGGFKVSVAELVDYNKAVEAEQSSHWDVLCNGERWNILKQ